jgi:hypothetical protein
MLRRTLEWQERVTFSPVSNAGLGFGLEVWDGDPTTYEAGPALAARRRDLGQRPTKSSLAADLSRFLIGDVLVAVGGIESAVERLHVAVEQVRMYVAENDFDTGEAVPSGIAHEGTVAAWYAFADVIIWARALEDRLSRRPNRDRKTLRDQGLIPALRPKRLKKRAAGLFDQLTHGPVGECRRLVNLSLHAALVKNPWSGAVLHPDGALTLPIPDTPPTNVDHWYLLTWDQGRDGIAFAEDLWASVERFVDGLIEAFEMSVPKRLRRQDAAS